MNKDRRTKTDDGHGHYVPGELKIETELLSMQRVNKTEALMKQVRDMRPLLNYTTSVSQTLETA